MGCQKEIAKQIVGQEADFVLALKDNQPNLCDAVNELQAIHIEEHFTFWRSQNWKTEHDNDPIAHRFAQTVASTNLSIGKGHGRNESEGFIESTSVSAGV